MLLIDSADTASVRAAIDVTLTEDVLSDTVILLDIFAGRASVQALTWRDVLHLELPDNDPRLKRAAVLLTASYLVLRVPVLLAEKIPDYSKQFASVDKEKLAAELASEAYDCLAELVVDESVGLSVFTVAHGTRGAMWPLGGNRAEGARPYAFGADSRWPL